jgi:hypothetical protein
MKKLLAIGLFVLGLSSPVAAQSLVVQTCGTLPLAYAPGAARKDTVDVNGNKCISGSITTSVGATAQSTLPSLSPGAGNALYESLSGGLFVNPTFGTTPVDATHGLPVNVIAGGAGGGAVFGPTAVGSAAANPPVLVAGTANAGATGTVQVAKVSASGLLSIDGSAVTQPVSATSLPLPTGAATAANQTTANASLATIASNTGAAIPAQSNHTTNIGAVDLISPYPGGAIPITASATGTTAATTATLAGTTGKTTYICGYSIRANATANTNVTNTLTGVISGTMSSIMWIPANTAGLGVDEQIFSPCIPASTTNTGIAAVSGAPGTGGLVSVKAWGYQL